MAVDCKKTARASVREWAMNALWLARTAIASATKGWLCVWLLLLMLSTVSLLRSGGHHAPFTDMLFVLLLWVVSTGVVTLAATIFLIVPYVYLRSADTLLHKPWLMYVESGVLAIFSGVVVTHFTKASAVTFWGTLYPYLMFALPTSLTSSAFYMQRVKSMSKQ